MVPEAFEQYGGSYPQGPARHPAAQVHGAGVPGVRALTGISQQRNCDAGKPAIQGASRTQITRHDCVEGWSAIGKWKGVPLTAVLEAVRPTAAVRYVVFHCADPMESDGSSPYYESIDMDDAYHPQTILAYELNDKALPIANGAPIRLRVERQLGYKHAKYVMRIELVDSFEKIAGGKGGYWEDQGYEWYAGI
jgi:DMSO/TMAO reductase YedYZ molybdopterin-dependent catalytic subunit